MNMEADCCQNGESLINGANYTPLIDEDIMSCVDLPFTSMSDMLQY